jgi:hypothetical protein
MHVVERSYSFSVQVNTAADVSYRFIENPRNLPSWDASIDHVLVTGPNTFVVYLRTCPACVGLATVIYTKTANAADSRPSSFVLLGASAGFKTRETLKCEVLTDTSCVLSYTVVLKLSGWRVLFTPFIHARVLHITRNAGRKLKRVLESNDLIV